MPLCRGRKTYNARDLDGVGARHVSIQSLPLCDPAVSRVLEEDDALVDGAGAVVDVGFVGALHLEKLAVGAAVSPKVAPRRQVGADHAGAQVLHVVRRDEGFRRHVGGLSLLSLVGRRGRWDVKKWRDDDFAFSVWAQGRIVALLAVRWLKREEKR